MKKILAGLIIILSLTALSVSVFSTDYNITFEPPTPNNTIVNTDYSYINVSLDNTINLDKVFLEWNGTNETMSNVTADIFFLNKTSLSNGNYTFRVWANDTEGNYSVSESVWVYINYTAPEIPDNPPVVTLESPEDNHNSTTGNIIFNCSVTDDNQLANITLYHNISGNWSANETKNISGTSNSTVWTVNNISNGTSFVWNCLAYDNASNSSWANSNRTVNIVIPINDTTDPTITSYHISPLVVQNGSGVLIGINATDNVNISSVWAVITKPDSSTENISLTNNADTNYTSTSLLGNYTVIIHANDTSGNEANVSLYFYSGEQKQFSVNVVGYNQIGINSSLTIYYSGTTNAVGSYSNSTGEFSDKNIIDYVYDFLFKAYSDNLQVLLKSVNISQNLNRTLGMDKLNTPVSGYVVTYAVNNTYDISGARVRIYYNETGVNESNLVVYVCSNWSFGNRRCTGNWNSTSATQNTAANFFDIEVSGFSAFSIKDTGYCGDGICNPLLEDTTSCPVDCICTPGDTRACSFAHNGSCAVGNETCVAGAWTGCPSPTTETCNTFDDDCDGIIDNVGGGTSVIATHCQCYNGGRPVAESCNNIDDDCDGIIDEGVTRPCGSDIGKCRMGTRPCINGNWSTICQNEIKPDANETCGNNIDDDCDGEIDEGCTNTMPCSYGMIPDTGCLCGNITYVAGYCCNGIHQTDPCPEFPWWIFIIVGILIIVVYFVYRMTKKKGEETTWEELEKKYTPAKM